MTEIEHRTENTTVEQTNQGGQEHALVQWAYAAQEAHKIAQSLAKTSFVPRSLQNKPGDITAAILAGQELGLQPMAALRSMDIIQGTPALRAHAMRGLVQSRGHEIKLVESSEAMCVMAGRRKGEDWQEVVWTIDRAQKLQLTGKDQWKKQPQAMLVARATGEICRLVASDVLHAMPYASEELDGYGQADGPQVPRVTVREFNPDAPQEGNGGVAEDDPWNPRNAVGVDSPVEGSADDEDAATFDEYVGSES